MAWDIWVKICYGNGLLPVRHQAINSRNADFFVNLILVEVQKFPLRKIYLECRLQNIVNFVVVLTS